MNFKKHNSLVVALVSLAILGCAKNTSVINKTNANEPALKLNTELDVLPNATPKHNDFIVYNYESEMFGKQQRIHRLVALAGDVLQIKEGVLFINDKNVDEGQNLIHYYKLSTLDYMTIKAVENINEAFPPNPINKDTVIALLKDKVAGKHGLIDAKYLAKIAEQDSYIKKTYGKDWNQDNFGPLTIPKGKVFVLGDNRHSSEDSRYIGLIDISEIVGVGVVKK